MTIKTKFLDFDARNAPRTNHSCVMCQKDMSPNKPYRTVHLVNGGPFILHPDSEPEYRPDNGDIGIFPIGNDCAKKVGLEWTHAPV